MGIKNLIFSVNELLQVLVKIFLRQSSCVQKQIL